MKLHIHNAMRGVQIIEATRIVIEDDLGNPRVVAIEAGPNQIFTSTLDDPRFNEVLRNLGIHKTVLVETVSQTPLDQVRFGGP